MAEGFYMPGDHRKKLVHLVRNTHFTLGEEAGSFESAHQRFFKKLDSPMHQAMTSPSSKSKNTNRNHSQDYQTYSRPPQSEFQAQYQPRKSLESALPKPIEERYKDQIQIGGSTNFYKTTAEHFHRAHSPQGTSGPVPAPNFRKHNFSIGTNKVQLESSMRSDFRYTKGEPSAPARSLQEIQASNVRMGCDPLHFSTRNKEQFGVKDSPKAPLMKPPNGKNIVFGIDRADYSPTSKRLFTAKQGRSSSLDEETLHNLKKDHFQLGGSPAMYQTVNSAVYSSKMTNPNPIAGSPKNSVKFGSDLNEWATSYQRFHRETAPMSNGNKSTKNKNESNVILGTANVTPKASTLSAFQETNGKANSLDVRQLKTLQTHHFTLGNDKSQIRRKSCEPKGNLEMNRNDLNAAVREMQSTHWSVGQQSAGYSPTSNNFAKLPVTAQVGKNPKFSKSNWKIGESRNFTGASAYKTSYNWVQPVPDRNYHYSVGEV